MMVNIYSQLLIAFWDDSYVDSYIIRIVEQDGEDDQAADSTDKRFLIHTHAHANSFEFITSNLTQIIINKSLHHTEAIIIS
ncbi:hypothetical protein L1987_81413 [Smallanthus sonchifolius]|uniref:Uncharacterized protein n=1 Tax=Smallanthus sonchifolius TaxID=185202 RepID=A0ACB8YQI1_9ASTR|nr:hypothetical protein L1987_81413 [Smallanthus sonchifolius]